MTENVTIGSTSSQAGVVTLVFLVLTALSAALAAPAAHARPYEAYLDVVEDNAEGEFAGGFSSRLPTYREILGAALDAARADDVPPSRHGALTRQYWLAVGAENAGIDLEAWEPAAGLDANLETVDRVYINYLRLYNEHDGFYWTGMAGLAGVSFAAGFWDLRDVGRLLSVPGIHDLGNATAAALSDLPWELAGDLPDDVPLLATLGPTLTQADLDWYLHRLLIKQRNIFMDMVPLHEAYAAGGIAAIDELAASGAYDDYLVEAWRQLDSGTREGRAEALLRMASREQNQIIADQWDATASDRDGLGRVLTYVTTLAGEPDVPGSSTLAGFRPLTVRTEVDGQRMAVHTPLPAFNWADRHPRWDYIADDLVPAFRSLVQDRPDQAPTYLDIDFRETAEHSRILNRLPDFASRMAGGWAVVPE